MTFAEVERLAVDLLGTGTLRDETANDLYRFRAEARAGQLHPDDLAYLRALHSRLLRTKPKGAASSNPEVKPQTDPLVDALKQLREAQATIATLQKQGVNAQRTIAELEQRQRAVGRTVARAITSSGK